MQIDKGNVFAHYHLVSRMILVTLEFIYSILPSAFFYLTIQSQFAVEILIGDIGLNDSGDA